MIRDGPDIRFSIRYPAKSGHFLAIQYPAGYRILKNQISGFLISGKPDINKVLFFILKDLRFENFSIIHHMSKIAGIRPDIQYPAPTRYPAGNQVSGFQIG